MAEKYAFFNKPLCGGFLILRNEGRTAIRPYAKRHCLSGLSPTGRNTDLPDMILDIRLRGYGKQRTAISRKRNRRHFFLWMSCNHFQPEGQKSRREAAWNSMNLDGWEVASGLYFYRISARDFSELKQMVLVKQPR